MAELQVQVLIKKFPVERIVATLCCARGQHVTDHFCSICMPSSLGKNGSDMRTAGCDLPTADVRIVSLGSGSRAALCRWPWRDVAWHRGTCLQFQCVSSRGAQQKGCTSKQHFSPRMPLPTMPWSHCRVWALIPPAKQNDWLRHCS